MRANPLNYDGWFDYIRLEESAGDIERTREVCGNAVPPLCLVAMLASSSMALLIRTALPGCRARGVLQEWPHNCTFHAPPQVYERAISNVPLTGA